MHNKLLLATSLWLASATAFAGNNAANSLNYRNDWPNGNPRALTLISDRTLSPLFGKRTFEGGVIWETARSEPISLSRERLCKATYRDMPCTTFVEGGIRVVEAYLGEPVGWKPYGVSTQDNIGPHVLETIGAGATKVLALTVKDRSFIRRSVTIAFDPVSDDELRDIALEDAVYRILRLRED